MEQVEAPEFRSALQDAGFTVIQETVDAGWWGVAAIPSFPSFPSFPS
jgi:hypothetical protein